MAVINPSVIYGPNGLQYAPPPRVPFAGMSNPSIYGPGGMANSIGTLPTPQPFTPPAFASMPADPAFGNSLGSAVQRGVTSYPGVTGTPTAINAAGFGSGMSAFKPLPIAGAVVGGIQLGDVISKSGWGNNMINSARGVESDQNGFVPDALSSIFMAPVKSVLGGARAMPGPVGEWANGLAAEGTNQSFLGMFGGEGGQPAGPDLTAPAIEAKVNALNLSPESRQAFVADYNTAIQDRVTAGMPVEQAAAQVHALTFGAVGADGSYTPGAAQQYVQAEAAEREQAHKAVAMQALMANIGGGSLQGYADTANQYNAMASGIIPQLPQFLQPLAGLQAATFNRDQQNLMGSTADFYQALPLMMQREEDERMAQAIQQRLQSQALATQYPSQATAGNALRIP